MPQIDLSTLDGTELRSLLDSARRQGHAAQSYEILREMEARRHRRPRPRNAAPHTISLELGDPLERKEDPLPNQMTEDLGSLTLADRPASRRPPPAPPPARKPRGWAHWGALLFALGLAGGVAGGWWAADFANGGASQPASSAPAPAPSEIQTAALAPAVPPANAEPSVSLVPDAGQVPPPPPPPSASDAAATTITPTATTAAEPITATPASAPATTVVAASPADAVPAPKAKQTAGERTCGSETTPADRTICADPKLRSLQTELRKAYAAALDAHEDKALLRQRELAWAEARNEVSDPDQLATLYRQRIEKLRAATADALSKR